MARLTGICGRRLSVRFTKSGATVRGIANEGQLDHVSTSAAVAGCRVTFTDCSTVATVTGTAEQMQTFVRAWNGELPDEAYEQLWEAERAARRQIRL